MLLQASWLALALVVAVAAGLMGCLAVMRRMTLAADALSHVALPGIALALVMRVHPFFGAVAALLVGALVVWGVERRARLATEAVIGVVFSAALAAGSLAATGEELIDALFGGTRPPSLAELVLGFVVSLGVIAFVLTQRHKLVLMLVSRDLARTAGIDVRRLDLTFLLLFALTVAVGLRYSGVLLMGSLIIIPAATARRQAGSLSAMFGWAVAIAVVATLAGTLAAARLHRAPGPLIVLAAAACFVLGLARRRAPAV